MRREEEGVGESRWNCNVHESGVIDPFQPRYVSYTFAHAYTCSLSPSSSQRHFIWINGEQKGAEGGGGEQAARYRDSTRNADLSPLIETGLPLSRSVRRGWIRCGFIITKRNEIVSPFIYLIILLGPFREERQSLIVDRRDCDDSWLESSLNSPEDFSNYLIGLRVNRISSNFEFSARTIVREIDLLSVQWNEFAMARQGNNKDWGERIFGGWRRTKDV